MTSDDHSVDKAVPVALLGADYPGLRIKLAVREGDVVAVGQTLFYDAKRTAISFVSPIQGRVSAIHFGPRRILSAMLLTPCENGPSSPNDRLETDVRAYLLARGMWPAFVARPFGGPPDPDAHPDAIVVHAVPSDRKNAPIDDILVGRVTEFARGLHALTELSDGTVHVCIERGAIVPIPGHHRIHMHKKRATRFWRTASGQVARVHPTGPSGHVWTIGIQDVIAIGHLLETGLYDPLRRVNLRVSGPARAKNVRLPLGASLAHVFGDTKQIGADTHFVSGTARHGWPTDYLGRYHDDVGIAHRAHSPARSMPQALIPFTTLNRLLPARVPTVPLMRALSIGDTQACATLGCVELLEEDVAPLSAICSSGTEYSRCLRNVLDQLRKDAA